MNYISKCAFHLKHNQSSLVNHIVAVGSILFLFLFRLSFHSHSGGLSNFLYYVSLPDDIDSCNNVKNIKRARKDASPQEPKEVIE